METKQNSAHLTSAEIAGVIQHFGLNVASRSPLDRYREVKSTLDQWHIDKKLSDSDAWRKALELLASPGHRVRATIIGPNGSLISHYYGAGNGDADSLVGCWEEEDGLRISFPWTAQGIASVAGYVVSSPIIHSTFPEELNLTPDGLVALASVIDAVRQSQIEALATRKLNGQKSFDAGSLVDQASVGLAHNDPRWVVTLLRDLAPSTLPMKPGDLRIGLDELVKAGVITISEGAWEPAEWIRKLAERWSSPLPAAAHETITMGGDQIQSIQHLIAIRGDGPLWTISYEGISEGSPRATFKNVDQSDYLESLAEIIRSLGPSEPQEIAKEKPPDADVSELPQNFCTKCGIKLEPGLKFCTECGQPIANQ